MRRVKPIKNQKTKESDAKNLSDLQQQFKKIVPGGRITGIFLDQSIDEIISVQLPRSKGLRDELLIPLQ